MVDTNKSASYRRTSTETSSWRQCRFTTAQSSRLFVFVIGIAFVICGSVLLWRYSRVKLRDFLVLGVGMLVVGIAFVAIIAVIACKDRCKSLVRTLKANLMSTRRVSDSPSQLETPPVFMTGHSELYPGTTPTSCLTDGRKLSGSDKKSVRISFEPTQLPVALPPIRTSEI